MIRRPPPVRQTAAAAARRFAFGLRRFALRTERGPLRPIWSLVYELAARCYALYLTRGNRRASVYTSGSLGFGHPLYGLSDIDLRIVLSGDPGRARITRGRVRRRWERLQRTIPLLAGPLLDKPIVFEERDLEEAASAPVLTYGLDDHGGRSRSDGAIYFGPASDPDKVALHEKPGLYGAGSDWRRIIGHDLRPPAAGFDPQTCRIAAWLELQSYWRWFLQECVNPATLRMTDLCVKLVAEPTRILLWLTYGERLSGRAEVLERGRDLIPEEEQAIVAALELDRRLARSPTAPLAQLLPSFVRLSSRVGARLAEEVAPNGTTQVRLVWDGPGELLLSPNNREFVKRLGERDAEGRLLPLVDWRALAHPDLPDETLVPISSNEPIDPGRLAELAQVGNTGAYPALLSDGLLVLASHRYPRSALRGVQCAVTDPVSFALLAGDTEAAFPDVRGWSARDWGRRAVAEHRAWLVAGGAYEEPGRTLAMLLTAARAALFLESVEAGAPELPLTVAAVVQRLLAEGGGSTVEEAEGSFRQFVLEETQPPSDTVTAFRELVRGLPAYAASAVEYDGER